MVSHCQVYLGCRVDGSSPETHIPEHEPKLSCDLRNGALSCGNTTPLVNNPWYLLFQTSDHVLWQQLLVHCSYDLPG